MARRIRSIKPELLEDEKAPARRLGRYRPTTPLAIKAARQVMVSGPLYQMDHSVVYFFQSGDCGPIKIGFARNVRVRLHTVQSGNPEHVTCIGHIIGDKSLEKAIHYMFRHLRVRAEWFCASAELMAFIASNATVPR